MTCIDTPQERAEIVRLHRASMGRNDIARQLGRSPGIVSKIAREEWIEFAAAGMTATATEAHRADMVALRALRESQALDRLDAALRRFPPH